MKLLLKLFVIISVWIGLINFNTVIADAKINPLTQVVDGISVSLNVVPVETVKNPNESTMHGGLPTGQYRYHISIKIVSNAGTTLHQATISARFSTASKKTEFKTLDVMDKKSVYGNFFTISEAGPYKIEVIIKHPNYSKPIHTVFDYKISHASLIMKPST